MNNRRTVLKTNYAQFVKYTQILVVTTIMSPVPIYNIKRKIEIRPAFFLSLKSRQTGDVLPLLTPFRGVLRALIRKFVQRSGAPFGNAS